MLLCWPISLDDAPAPGYRAALRPERRDLAEARRAAEGATDAAGWHWLGVLCVAVNDLRAAERAFSRAFELDPQAPPSLSGKEEEAGRPGSALRDALLRQRFVLSLDLGAAAARNNRGAVLLALGAVAAAQKELDEAALLRPDWGTPWANSALAWLERGNPEKALETAQVARLYGESSAQVALLKAEAHLRRGRTEAAWSALREAESRAPGAPYVLATRARLLEQIGQGHAAERARIQALALAPGIASEGRQTPLHADYGAQFGTPATDAARLGIAGYSRAISAGTRLQRVGTKVEGRNHAGQSHWLWEAMGGSTAPRRSLAFLARVRAEDSGRPGPEGMASAAAVDAEQQGFTLVTRQKLASTGQLLLAAKARSHRVSSRPSARSEATRTLRDGQAGAEGRWDAWLPSGILLQTGLAYLQNRRAARKGDAFSTATEPNEQLLALGATRMTTAYALARRQLSRDASLSLGPVFGVVRGDLSSASPGRAVSAQTLFRSRSEAVWMPALEYARRLSATRWFGVSLTPQLQSANSALIPLETDRAFLSAFAPESSWGIAPDRPAAPSLLGPAGRILHAELRYGVDQPEGDLLHLTGFYRSFRDIWVLTGDPRLSPTLEGTAVTRGQATGIEGIWTRRAGPRLGITVAGRWQTSRTRSETSVYPPAAASSLAYFPSWQGKVRLDLSGDASWGGALEWEQIGRRSVGTNSVYYPGGGFSGGTVGETRLIRASAFHRRGRQEIFGSIQLPVSGRAARGFFQGYPFAPALVLGVRVQP